MTARWGFVWTRRWLGYVACAVAFAVACGFLAHWQLSRSHEAATANARMTANFTADPVPLNRLVSSLDSFDESDEWHPVEVRGTYLPDDELYVRNRPYEGEPGFEVLTPLLTSSGDVFVVDRGWVGMNSTDDPASSPPVPSGTVRVTARLRPAESHDTGQTAAGDLLPRVWPQAVAAETDRATYTQVYGVLVTQDPPTSDGPTALYASPPLRNEGLHWSYMIQWIIFALIGFFGLGYGIRQEYLRRHREESGEGPTPAPAPPRRRRRRHPSEAEIEDAILDAQSSSR